jgi:hypothetical protein
MTLPPVAFISGEYSPVVVVWQTILIGGGGVAATKMTCREARSVRYYRDFIAAILAIADLPRAGVPE